jgi:branched-chain amino acid transport system substrate-binding protein
MPARVYVSLPLTGRFARPGRDVLRGAELALEAASGPVPELVVLDSDHDDRDGRAEEHARDAIDDPDAVAYLGDFHSSQVARSGPVLAEAGMLVVAPVATRADLHGATLVRLMGDDVVGACAAARWLERNGVRDLLLVHDHDSDYGEPVGLMHAQAARERGLSVRVRPVWDHDEPPQADLDGAQAVLYVGVAGSGAVDLWQILHAADPTLWLLGSDGVAAPWLAHEMGPGPASRTRFFIAQRAPLALYGHAAMTHVLDAVREGDNRATVAAAGRSRHERSSAIGRYALDDDGLTTSQAYGRLVVVDGALAWDR